MNRVGSLAGSDESGAAAGTTSPAERAGAAGDVVLVIGLETAGRMGVGGIVGQRLGRQDHEAVDRDACTDGVVARELHRAAGIVQAIVVQTNSKLA